MRTMIVNNTNLNYETLGKVIDNIQMSDTGTTMYYGKVDIFTVNVGNYKIKVQIRYLKRYVELLFEELENKDGN